MKKKLIVIRKENYNFIQKINDKFVKKLMSNNKIEGYKAFNKNMTNYYGMRFEEGKIYTTNGKIKFGLSGNGYHFCKRIEDTFRYFPAWEEEISIAKVTSLEDVAEWYDDYYEYYDMYAARTLMINKILTRKEIIEIALAGYQNNVERFIKRFKLTPDEIELFKNKFHNNLLIWQAIAYYQEDNKNAYKSSYCKEFFKSRYKVKY